MPAITRTAPSRIAMLTESSDAMTIHLLKYLQLHPYRRRYGTPTPFCRQRQWSRLAGVCGVVGAFCRWRRCRDYGNLRKIRIKFAPIRCEMSFLRCWT
jgi:hypothetical protein